jgi:hypothetical protein
LASEVAFIILFLKISVFPSTVKKGGSIEKVAKKMKGMVNQINELQKNEDFKRATNLYAISAAKLLAAPVDSDEEEEEDGETEEEEANEYI